MLPFRAQTPPCTLSAQQLSVRLYGCMDLLDAAEDWQHPADRSSATAAQRDGAQRARMWQSAQESAACCLIEHTFPHAGFLHRNCLSSSVAARMRHMLTRTASKYSPPTGHTVRCCTESMHVAMCAGNFSMLRVQASIAHTHALHARAPCAAVWLPESAGRY